MGKRSSSAFISFGLHSTQNYWYSIYYFLEMHFVTIQQISKKKSLKIQSIDLKNRKENTELKLTTANKKNGTKCQKENKILTRACLGARALSLTCDSESKF